MKRLSEGVRKRGKGKDINEDKADLLPSTTEEISPNDLELVELQLVEVLKQNGVAEICKTIKSEIDTIWAVQTSFKTLASVGHFYFSCGEQVFAISPAEGFFDSDGLLLALFALKKFPHQREVLFPVLDTISIYAKLDVERALSFCAVEDGAKLIMDCVRNHYDKPELICMAQEALGSLILNDDIRLHIASKPLIEELLNLLRRYKGSPEVARAVLYPLSHFVVLKDMAHHFVELNGIPTVLQCLQMHKDDQQSAWYALALLNALTTDTYHTQIIGCVFENRGVHTIARAIAKHIEVEEIALEGFQLLESIATLADFFHIINQNHVLELAYHALSLYKGAQYTHTRLEIKKRVLAFQTCAVQDGHAYAMQERLTKGDCILYTIFLLFTAIATSLSPYNQYSYSHTTAMVHSLRTPRNFSDVSSVWAYLEGSFVSSLYPSRTQSAMETPQMIGSNNLLLGSVQFRQERFNAAGDELDTSASDIFGVWSDTLDCQCTSGGGYLATLPNSTLAPQCSNDPYCVLSHLRSTKWLDSLTRKVAVEWNVYNAALDLHCAMHLVFHFDIGGSIRTQVTALPVYFNVYRGVFLASILFYLDLTLIGFTLYIVWRAAGKLNRYRQYYFYIGSHLVDFSIVVLWVAIWYTRIQFLVTANYPLMLRLAETSYVSIQGVAILPQRERYLFSSVSIIMWLNWTRYISFHHFRYLICVLEATRGYIVAYIVSIAILLIGVSQYLAISNPELKMNMVDLLIHSISNLNHGMQLSSQPDANNYFIVVLFNTVLTLIMMFSLSPFFHVGYTICPRETNKKLTKASSPGKKDHLKPTMRTAILTAKTVLKRMLEERQETIQKHAFSPWEKSDASMMDDITEENYVNPAAPALLQELQRGVVRLAVEEQHFDILTTNLLRRLQQLQMLM